MGAEVTFRPAAALLLVPFPAQGHVTPMLHLARALAAHGVAATVAVPDFIHRRMAGLATDGNDGGCGGVALVSIPSGIVAKDGGAGDTPPEFGAIAHAMEHHMPAQLERMLARRRLLPPVSCLVVDVLASWAVPVAERCGVPVAGFWPAMLACYRVVAAIPELIEDELISESGTPISSNGYGIEDQMIRGLEILPGQVELRAKDLPWLVGDSATQASRFAFWLQTLHRARSFRWVLVNSFHGEDDDVHQQLLPARRQVLGPLVLPVRPALLLPERPDNSVTIGERTKPQQQQQPCGGKSPCSSMWRGADSSCIGWLDAQRAGSVVYVSFGSWVGPIGPDKVRELALGLEAAGRPFLWALKRDPSWRSGLPDGFAEADEGRGKVVDWAPQEDVLRHAAVGCYLTHCGWNSTVEAIQHGVRLLCCPVAGDQFINCAYITGLWGIGLKLGGAVSRDDVKRCIERIMDGEEGRRLQENVTALREKVVKAEARRTAEMNVKLFVDEIKREQPLLMQIFNASSL